MTNDKSLIVYLFSNDSHVYLYEKDLAMSIALDSIFVPAISLGRQIPSLENSILDIKFIDPVIESDDFYFISAVLVGQLLGFYKSAELGLQPDNPSVSGSISRVVQGVTIYPIKKAIK